jgi:hypothetical protein
MDYEQLKANWNSLFSAAGWITGTVYGFWKAPMLDPAVGASDAITRFARFAVAIAIATMTPLLIAYRHRRHARGWTLSTVFLLVLAVAAFLSYEQMKDSWITRPTQKCDKRSLVGNYRGLLDYAKQFYDAHPECRYKECLVDNASCDPSQVWTQESIANHGLWLKAAYIGLVPIFAAAMLCAGQILCCLNSA